LVYKHEEQGREVELQKVKKTKREMKRVKLKFTRQKTKREMKRVKVKFTTQKTKREMHRVKVKFTTQIVEWQ
jgi:hypothetical protein